jgi:hypothetical protein
MFKHTIHRAPLCSVAPFGVLRWLVLVMLLAMAISPSSAQDLALRAAQLTREGASSVAGAPASESLDLRYRIAGRYHVFAGAAPVRGLADAGAVAPVSARVGMDWQPSKSTLGLEQGAIGVQLESGTRMSLKARRGGPMLYLRNRF